VIYACAPHPLSQLQPQRAVTEQYAVEDQQDKIYKWLEKVNPSRNHNDAKRLIQKNTGLWIFEAAEWKSWADAKSQSRLFWVHGIPGAGKTILAHTMIERVRPLASTDRKKGLAYYYCYHARNKDETVPFLMWVLSQLCRASGHIPGSLTKLYGTGCEPTVGDLLRCLEAALASFEVAYVVVDAIDESKPPTDIVKALSILATEPRFTKIRLAITSREHTDIERAFHNARFASMSLTNNVGVIKDISDYVTTTLRQERYHIWGEELRIQVAGQVAEKAHGM
jgi:hypothetical protein